MPISEDELKRISAKYKERLKKEISKKVEKEIKKSKVDDNDLDFEPTKSVEYKDFLRENMPAHLTIYEKLCNYAEKSLKLKPNKKKEEKLKKEIETSHLSITPSGAISFSILYPVLFILIGSILSLLLFNSMFFLLFCMIIGLIAMVALQNLPEFIATNFRMKASNQMVLCIFYVVTYMRHTSNLERAIEFAAEHIAPPLSYDLKKVLWDVETGKYESVKMSLDAYLETWREYNMEFIESFHLIMSSLYETSEERRLSLLDKSLEVILDETFERMLHYAQNLKSPITMLHMLGIVMPILGLVILPLMVNFLGGVKWYHISFIYNIILPIVVYFMGKGILSKRPSGYGSTDFSLLKPELKKYSNIVIRTSNKSIYIPAIYVSGFLFILLLLIGLLPLILHYTLMPGVNEAKIGGLEILGYRISSTNPDKIIGPYGIVASILSLFLTLAVGLGLGTYYAFLSKNLIIIRNKTLELEKEFGSAIFQLGNRIGDGFPAEIAFSKVADTLEGTMSGKFFKEVSQNILSLGMSVKDAIFDSEKGVIKRFPSNLIESSMKVLIQSIKKGPQIAAQAMVSVSNYIKQMHRVEERLKDLMADVISDMKSQISFLTPAIAAIVIGITSMITNILGKLSASVRVITEEGGEAAQGAAGGSTIATLANMFGDGIPTYFFQIIVGLYVVQIIFILTILENGIENGADKLNEKHLLGKNLKRGVLLYCFISLVIMIIFNIIASVIMESTVTST